MQNPEQFISFDRIDSWNPSDKTIAVIGDEAGFHAQLHRAALSTIVSLNPELEQWQIIAVEANQDNVSEVIQKLHGKKVWGVVVTRPLKTDVLKLLTVDIMAPEDKEGTPATLGSAEALAERVGAVNILTWRPNGYWGISTDAAAWTKAFEDEFSTRTRGKHIVVVGAGAVARAVATEVLQKGCRELWLGNRTQEHAWDALDQILPSINMRGRSHTFNLIKPSHKVPKNAIIVNTLPQDARVPGNPTLDLQYFDRSSLYFDTEILPTPSHALAQQEEMKHCTGVKMWAYQLVDHLEVLIGAAPSLEFVQWAVTEAAAQRHL